MLSILEEAESTETVTQKTIEEPKPEIQTTDSIFSSDFKTEETQETVDANLTAAFKNIESEVIDGKHIDKNTDELYTDEFIDSSILLSKDIKKGTKFVIEVPSEEILAEVLVTEWDNEKEYNTFSYVID